MARYDFATDIERRLTSAQVFPSRDIKHPTMRGMLRL